MTNSVQKQINRLFSSVIFTLKFNSYSVAQSYRFGKPDRSIWIVLIQFLHGFEFGDYPELGALLSP